LTVSLGAEGPRLAREAEIRRRYDRAGLVAALGRYGEAMARVVDACPRLEEPRCRRLAEEWEAVRDDARASGDWDGLAQVYACSSPYPEHPGNLYAVDGWARNAFNYAGLVARERANAVGAPLVPVERSAAGMIMALAMDASDAAGTYSPFGPPLRALLRRPWVAVLGDPLEA